MAAGPRPGCPAGNSGMLGGFWNAAVLLPPLPGLLDTQGIPPSYIQPPSL